MNGFRRWTIVVAILSAMTSFAAYELGVVAVCTDCISRAFFAMTWWHRPNLYQVIYWLPLHSILFGLPGYLTGKGLVAIHLLNALCAGATVFLGARLTETMTGSPRASLCSALLIASSPLYVWFGVSMLSEPFFNVLVLAFVLAFLAWIRTSSRIQLWMSVLLLLLMSMDRWFAWPVAAGFGLYVIGRERRLESLFPVVASWAFPILWMSLMMFTWGDPFFAIRFQADDSRTFYGANQPFAELAIEFLHVFAIPLLGLAVLAATWRRLPRNLHALAVAGVGALALETAIIWGRIPTVFPLRSFSVSGLFLLGVAGSFLGLIWERRWVGSGWIGALLAVSIGYQVALLPNHASKLDEEMLRAGTKLRSSPTWNRMIRKNPVGVDLDPLRGMHLAVASDRPDRFVHVRFDHSRTSIHVEAAGSVPQMFVVKNAEDASTLIRLWPQARAVKIEDVYLVSANETLLAETKP
ncbi:MAG: hypothetical protein V1495_04620 [Pseudomonadota bacterium]